MAVLCHFQADNGAIRGLAWLPSQVGWSHHAFTVLHMVLSMSLPAGALFGRPRTDCSLLEMCRLEMHPSLDMSEV